MNLNIVRFDKNPFVLLSSWSDNKRYIGNPKATMAMLPGKTQGPVFPEYPSETKSQSEKE